MSAELRFVEYFGVTVFLAACAVYVLFHLTMVVSMAVLRCWIHTEEERVTVHALLTSTADFGSAVTLTLVLLSWIADAHLAKSREAVELLWIAALAMASLCWAWSLSLRLAHDDAFIQTLQAAKCQPAPESAPPPPPSPLEDNRTRSLRKRLIE